MVIAAVLRLPLLQMPLERDEGEFAYMGQLILQGIPPYLLAYNMKLPGTYAIYAAIMAVFGQSVFAIHLGLLIFNSLAIVFVFLVTRHLAGETAAAVAAPVYAVMSASPSVLGMSAHATQFLVPFALAGIFFILKACEGRKTWMLAASGLLLGTSFLMKQHAVFFIAFALLFYLNRLRRARATAREIMRNTAVLVICSLLPFAAVCGLLHLAGVFRTFWYWTFTYSSQYASIVPLSAAWSMFMAAGLPVMYPWRLIWLIAFLGLTSVCWNNEVRGHRDFWLGFACFSILSICPGFFFRNHYFVTLLPAAAMMSGVGVSSSMAYLSRRFPPYLKSVPLVFLTPAILFPLWSQAAFFLADPVTANRMIYRGNPFPETVAAADYIREHSLVTDTVAVIGSEPQIYFHANRKSATGYIYVYGLMEPHGFASRMQKEMIQEIESAEPRYIVFVNENLSWLVRRSSDPYIFNWARKYLSDHYLLRGVIGRSGGLKTDIDPQDTGLAWQNMLAIMERKK